MKPYITIILLGLLSVKVFAYDFYVRSTNSHVSKNALIDSVEFHITPHGAYMQYDMYMSVSAPADVFAEDEELEFVGEFILPETAAIYDSWLWIDSVPVQAHILDLPTAEIIYQEYAGIEAKDPLLLKKEFNTSVYELRIFPLKGNKARMFKLSMLIPAGMSSDSVVAPLPLSLLKTHLSNTDVINCVVHEENGFSGVDFPGTQYLKTETDSSVNRYEIPWSEAEKGNITVSFRTENKKAYFASAYSDESGDYFQLVLFPELLMDESLDLAEGGKLSYDVAVTSGGASSAYILNCQKQIKPASVVLSGKLFGDGPYVVDYSFLFKRDSGLVAYDGLLDVSFHSSDSLLKTFWASEMIALLEEDASYYSDPESLFLKQLMDLSIENRIVSKESAFLAIDPALGADPEVCYSCFEYGPAAVEKSEFLSGGIYVSPNPVKERARVKIELPADEQVIFAGLYSLSGELVVEFQWDNSVEWNEMLVGSKGMYMLVVKTDKHFYSVQVLSI